MNKIKFSITQEDIDKDGHQCGNCPAHRSIRRHYPRCGVVVASNIIFIETMMKIYKGKSPDLADWVYNYDDMGPSVVSPQAFEIELEEVNDLDEALMAARLFAETQIQSGE